MVLGPKHSAFGGPRFHFAAHIGWRQFLGLFLFEVVRRLPAGDRPREERHGCCLQFRLS